MFEDFHPTANSAEALKRKRQSLFAACLLYGTSFGGMVAATATAREVIEEEETQVTFAPAPEPEPEPEPPPPPEVKPEVKNLRPKANRPKLTPPDKVSDEKLKESDKALAEAESTGPVDGFLDGVEGGQGNEKPPPPPPPKAVAPPRPPIPVASTFERPRYSSKAKRKGVEGVVVVSFVITENGTIKNLKVVSGAPELVEMVLKWAPTWRYKPAMKDGKPIQWAKKETIRFRLEDA
jgi:periplasmic protein TonB